MVTGVARNVSRRSLFSREEYVRADIKPATGGMHLTHVIFANVFEQEKLSVLRLHVRDRLISVGMVSVKREKRQFATTLPVLRVAIQTAKPPVV
jgi:hypothetical protein